MVMPGRRHLSLAIVPLIGLLVAAHAAAADGSKPPADDAAFFDAYLAAKRESPRSPVKALVESVLWGFQENLAPPSLSNPAFRQHSRLQQAESLYAKGQYRLAEQTLSQLSDADRRADSARVAGLQAQLALRGFGRLPAMVASDDEKPAFNRALALAAPGDATARRQAIAELRRWADGKSVPPTSRHRALLWIALLQHANGDAATAARTLAAIDGDSSLLPDALLVWIRTQPTATPLAAAVAEREIALRLPASPAAWEARDGLIRTLLAAGASGQAGEVALEGITSCAEQVERADEVLNRLAQAPLGDWLSVTHLLPEGHRLRVATLLDRKQRLGVERRLNAWLPYLFSYRGKLQIEPEKFLAAIRGLLAETRTALQTGQGSANEALGMLRLDIDHLIGSPPSPDDASRLFTGLARWELDASYAPGWTPGSFSTDMPRALSHTAQLLDRLAARDATASNSAGPAMDRAIREDAEQNNTVMGEIREVFPTVERALRDEIAAGLHERRAVAQQWLTRFAFHTLHGLRRHDPERAARFDFSHLPPVQAGLPPIRQLNAIGSPARLEKASYPNLAVATTALRNIAASGESRRLRAEAMNLLAQTIVAQSESRQLTGAGEAIAVYSTLLKDFRDLVDPADIRYQLARAQEHSRRFNDQLATLNAFATEYPGDPRAVEAMFRIGEMHFSVGDYPAAANAYSSVIARGESDFVDRTEFMLGWTHYRLGQFRDALPHFFAVIDRAENRPGSDHLRRELAKENFRAIALTFANLGGDDEIGRNFTTAARRKYLPDLYASVAALHLERDRIQDAANGYASLTREFPDHPRAPELLAGVVGGARRNGLARLAMTHQEEFVTRFAAGTPYYRATDNDTRTMIERHLRSFLDELAALYHADAQQQGNDPARIESSRSRALHYYSQFIDGFPGDPELPRVLFLRGEARFESGDLNGALADYDRSAYDFGPHARAPEASYAALVTAEKLIAQGRTPEERRTRLRELVSRSSHFARSFAGDARVDNVLVKAGEDILMLGEPAEAITLGDNLLARNPPPEAGRRARVLLAHGLFETGAFGRAETAYQQALNDSGHAPALLATLRERHALSIYRQGEAFRAARQPGRAADTFLRAARTYPRDNIAAFAEIDATALMFDERRWTDAIPVLERFVRDRPRHNLLPKAQLGLALAYENSGRGLAAADLYEALSLATPEASAIDPVALASQQLLRAGELRRRDHRPELAQATFERFLARFPTPLLPAMEVRRKLADLAAADGDQARHERWLNEIVRVQAAAPDDSSPRIRHLAAQAGITLGDSLVASFEAVVLKPPFERTLAEKRRVMEQAIRRFDDAARLGILETTTAATYKTGELFRRLAADMLASEAPGGLKPAEMEQYRLLLEEQSQPFEDKASRLHEINLEKMAGGLPGGHYDEWIRRSMSALASLVPGRYHRPDAADTYFTYQLPKAAEPLAPARPAGHAATPPQPPAESARAR